MIPTPAAAAVAAVTSHFDVRSFLPALRDRDVTVTVLGMPNPVLSPIDEWPDWPQDPVLPREFSAHYGAGYDRAVVISGGGLAGLAFGAAYLNGLERCGVGLRKADLVVGTSAGSLLGTELLANDLRRLTIQLQLAARSRLFEYIRKDAHPHPTAARARSLFDDATDGKPATLIGIGHAALAAKAPSRLSLMTQIYAFVGRMTWPSAALRTTAYDSYSAERLVFCRDSRVPLLLALSASAAVPGLMTPVQIGGRRCMDGGMASGLNADLAAGARKVLVIGLVHDPNQGRWTNRKGQFKEEITGLRDAGTIVESRLPAEDLGDPMDATALALGLRLGGEQAAEDAAGVAAFWGS